MKSLSTLICFDWRDIKHIKLDFSTGAIQMNQHFPEIECNQEFVPKIQWIVGQLPGPGFTEVKSKQIWACAKMWWRANNNGAMKKWLPLWSRGKI